MRIVSGKYKGKKIAGYDLLGTRPTMDRVKESLFAMLQPILTDSICLDLFAGSGNLGFEALSQGAKEVVLVDKNYQALQVMKKNAALLQIEEKISFYQGDFKKILAQLQGRKFTLIFLDPPYETDYIDQALTLIHTYQLLTDQGWIVLESNDPSKVEPPPGYELIKYRKYGDKYISIIKPTTS